MYYMVKQSPQHFQHPKFPTTMAPEKIRKTTAWNVARMSDDSAEEIAEEMWNHFFKKQGVPRNKNKSMHIVEKKEDTIADLEGSLTSSDDSDEL